MWNKLIILLQYTKYFDFLIQFLIYIYKNTLGLLKPWIAIVYQSEIGIKGVH